MSLLSHVPLRRIPPLIRRHRVFFALAAFIALLLATGPARGGWSGAAWRGSQPGSAQALSEHLAVIVHNSLASMEESGGDAGLSLTVMGVDPGAPRFQGEWTFATFMMAAIGQAQLGLTQPELAEVQAARASDAIDGMLRPEIWAFDTQAWGEEALRRLDEDRHDHAVLGYAGLALSMERLLDPNNRHLATEDAVAAALARRLRDHLVLQTYPGESYPPDIAMALAAVALHARAVGQPPPAWLEPRLGAYQRLFVDERGLLIQRVEPGTGRARSVGRGSGTALAAWALAWADPDLSRSLSQAIREHLGTTTSGLVVVREYAPETCASGHACAADVDSGPVIMGAGVSATGFSLASARRLQDDAWFDGLWGTTRLFGGWTGSSFALGGDLGNAIMLAMLTARPLPSAVSQAVVTP
jgi:hypothetical protein